MITEHQQEQASLFVLGVLAPEERGAFEAELRGNRELREQVFELQRAADLIALAVPNPRLPLSLKNKVLARIDQVSPEAASRVAPALAGLRFLEAAGQSPWKPLPVPGAYVKLLTVERSRGYAVLLGKLDPGVRYPAHKNAGAEDFYILSGDLVVSGRKLVAGDFHHADAGSQHEENYSVEGCTLLAVL
jgi:hypothetical protein